MTTAKKPSIAAEYERQLLESEQSLGRGAESHHRHPYEHLDRFIPCRTQASLQAKFEAAS